MSPTKFSEKPFIYLASPFTHARKEIRDVRFELACLATANMLRKGLFVFSPIVSSVPVVDIGHFEGPTWDEWSDYDREFISRCIDRVWILSIEGWDQSRGVRSEVIHALESDLPVSMVDINGNTSPVPCKYLDRIIPDELVSDLVEHGESLDPFIQKYLENRLAENV